MDSSKLMGSITAVILAVIALYIFALGMGKIQGDITTVLLVLTLISFGYWLYDRICLKPKRIKQALEIEAKIRSSFKDDNAEELDAKVKQAAAPALIPPWWIEWTAGFFWVIFVVFAVRSFMLEPYRIPSGSMMPTLEAGDFILVSKSGYGITLPVANKKIIEFSKPKRGEVIVFRSPTEDLIIIKRIIGLPGDEIIYQDKHLTINGEFIHQDEVDSYVNTIDKTLPPISPQFHERVGEVDHNVLTHPYSSYRDNISMATPGFVTNRPYLDNCNYSGADFVCHVPEGHYFMMGDNRDFSLDSRYWGFVPEENIIGKAFFIWFNAGKLSRIGRFK